MLPLVVTLAVVLVGCGDQDEPEPSDRGDDTTTSTAPPPDQPTPSSTAHAGDPCGGISAAQLTDWSGTEQTLLAPDDTGAIIRCSTGYDEAGMIVRWSFTPVVGSLDVEADNAELPGLRRSPLELADGTPAWQLAGKVSGTRTARVVTVLGERTLSVDANDGGDSTATVTDDVLAEVSRRVADSVAAGTR
jgi:hypothetical protein